MSTTDSPEPVKPSLRDIFRMGARAIVTAAAINAVLFFIGDAMGAFPPDVLAPTGDPVTMVPAVMITAVAGAVATVGFLIITRFLSSGWTHRVMGLTTAAVLIGMFFTPFSLDNAPMIEIVFLEIMHVVAALPAYLLTRLY